MTFFERVTSKPGYRLLLAVLLVCMAGTIEYQTEVVLEEIEREHVKTVSTLPRSLTASEAQLAEFYARQGSPAAIEMAQATVQAKRPRLMAAVAAVESNGSPLARGRAGERGAWQVIPAIHGAVPVDAAGQMDQSERILEDLLIENGGSVKKAVAAYNGSGARADAYSRRVLAMLEEVPR